MPRTLPLPAVQHFAPRQAPRVAPSILEPALAEPFTLEQELKSFGAWTSEPIWVPPKDASETLAETMFRHTGVFASRQQRWDAVVQKHRSAFTQVRELDLFQASIRLPQGKFFVTVTEQRHFDQITDKIPACVQTRLEEFLSGPGKKWGAKVYYLKPLCVEVGDDLILTTREDLFAAITQVQDEAFAAYGRLARFRRPLAALAAVANAALALPRAVTQYALTRRQKEIEALHARLEFERRKLALEAAETHRRFRTNGCTFDEMLDLTTPIERTEVIEHYCLENELSNAQRLQLLQMAAGTLPWFVALSLTVSFVAKLVILATTPPVLVCDPAFVAEMPSAPGVLLKIGHFDEVGGITHVEL